MSDQQLSNLPILACLVVVIVIMAMIQRKQPQVAIGGWLAALGLITVSVLSGLVPDPSGRLYVVTHTVRLCCDLIAGIAILLFTGRPIAFSSLMSRALFCCALPALLICLLYGTADTSAASYILCAAMALAVTIGLGIYCRFPLALIALACSAWLCIAGFALAGNFRAACYWATGSVYLAATLRLRARLRHGSMGKKTVIASMFVWSLAFFSHPWIFPFPHLRVIAEGVWSMQRFVVVVGMFVILFEEQIRHNKHLASHDPLTGLPNRRLLEDRLRSMLDRGFAQVFLLDLNGFKQVNDSLGHDAGDRLLCSVADRLTALLQPEDTAARLGGDEFVIISARSSRQLAAEIESAIAQPVPLGISTISVSATIGVCTYPDDIAGADTASIIRQMLQAADRQMYQAKSRVRRRSNPIPGFST